MPKVTLSLNINLVFVLICAILIPFNSFGQELFNTQKLHQVEIEFFDKDWDRKLHLLKKNYNEKRLLATVKINGIKYDSVGVRYKGNSSYFSVRNHEGTKLPFNVKLNYIKKDQKLPSGHTKVKLSNIFRDPSYVREILSYEIAQKYLFVPKAGFTKVVVNGNYLGIYNIVEAIDKKFLESRFDARENTLIKCDALNYAAVEKAKANKNCPPTEYSSLMYMGKDTTCYTSFYELKSENTTQGYLDFIDMIEKLNQSPKEVHQVLDIDQTLWLLAFNNVLVNLDSYIGRLSHNYYFFQKNGGQFVPLLWDLNLSFGGFRYLANQEPLTIEEMQHFSMFAEYKNPKRPLIEKILSQPLYRKMYVHHIKTIVEENFSNDWYKRRGDEIRNFLDYAIQQEDNSLYDYQAFKDNFLATSKADKTSMIGISELMEERKKYLSEHPLIVKESPTISNVNASKTADNQIEIKASIENGISAKVFFQWDDKTTQTFDLSSEDATNFSTKIEIDGKKLSYFIVAEQEKTASIYPTQGSRNPKVLVVQ